MTIAISLKVHDGVVLAADSASTIVGQMGAQPPGVLNVYDHANKIANLCKGRPLGAVVWGAGSIGAASLSTLLKDLRLRFSGQDHGHDEWALTEQNSSVQHVAQRTRQFLFEEKYVAQFGPGPAPAKPSMGILVAGYSAGQPLPEAWLVSIREGGCDQPTCVLPQEQVGCYADGLPEAIHRFLNGHGLALKSALQNLGVGPLLIDGVMAQLAAAMSVPMIVAPMPIQDAIDLADFLVHMTKMFSRFGPGPPSVGGPTEIAAITKHEGFKWIKRKHYYEQRFNP